VLDYKIKELKKDIKPNAETIGVLKEQTTKMNQEVKHFSRVKTNLELIVTDMKLKMDGLIKENHALREKIEGQDALKHQFKDDIYDMLQHINDYKNLKKAIVRMYKKYVATKDGSKPDKAGGNSDLHKESTQQRQYLEQSLNNVTQKLIKS
jgi:cilia- and flagella-associated protein 57